MSHVAVERRGIWKVPSGLKYTLSYAANEVTKHAQGIDTASSSEDQLAQAVEANVRWSMQQLKNTPEGKAALEEGRGRLVGAVYEIRTGRVRFLH